MNYFSIFSLLLIGGLIVAGTSITNPQEAFSELFTGMEIYTETFGLPETFLQTDEIFMLFDTTNIANMSKVTVTANLPCSSSDDPRFKVAVGILGNSTNIIDSSAQSLNYTGPFGSCTYSGTVKAADENITIQRVWLTPNNGTNISHTFFGNLVTLTALLDDGNVESAPSSGIVATGGTITTNATSGKTVHTFTSSGTFEITSGSGNVEYLVVGAGGAGTSDGGGGAGGFLTDIESKTVGSYTVTIGTGGIWTDAVVGGSGGNSVFDSITAIGGGGGGGAGGGGGGAGGGGGGAGGGGGDSSGYGDGGTGGIGLYSSISGTSVCYAGGGGGGSWASNTDGTATCGGGSGGWGTSGHATAGTANTGGGSGDTWGATNGGRDGGSGVVIISYDTP